MKTDKSVRPIRNRKHNKRSWGPADIHRTNAVKRLFTPDIKRMLKEWLIRRRENPYPSREEKKGLAYETGLTYTQICNWFANWRRKLKNSGREPSKKSWGNLIKNYNNNAVGNVEQFSISSGDSINNQSHEEYSSSSSYDEDYNNNNIEKISNNFYQIENYIIDQSHKITNSNQNFLISYGGSTSVISSPDNSNPELSKWLHSAVNFQPNKKNYIDWNIQRDKTERKDIKISGCFTEHLNLETFHQKEIEAAEALANLWNETRQKMNQNTSLITIA